MSLHRYTRIKDRLRRYVSHCGGAYTASVNLRVSACFIQQILDDEPVPDGTLDRIEQSIGFGKAILSGKTSRRCTMLNCPLCEKPHRIKPTQCLLDAVDRHRNVCTPARRHDKACCLEDIVDFVANCNSRHWAELN